MCLVVVKNHGSRMSWKQKKSVADREQFFIKGALLKKKNNNNSNYLNWEIYYNKITIKNETYKKKKFVLFSLKLYPTVFSNYKIFFF